MSYFQRCLVNHYYSCITLMLLFLCHHSCTQHNDSDDNANGFATFKVESILTSETSGDSRRDIVNLELEITSERVEEVPIKEVDLLSEPELEEESILLSTSVNEIRVTSISEPFTKIPLKVEIIDATFLPDIHPEEHLRLQEVRNLENVTESELIRPHQEVSFPLNDPELGTNIQSANRTESNDGSNESKERPVIQGDPNATGKVLELEEETEIFSKTFIQTTRSFTDEDAGTENDLIVKSFRTNDESQLETKYELDLQEDKIVSIQQDLFSHGNHSNGRQICEIPDIGQCCILRYPKYYFNPRTKTCETFIRSKCDDHQNQNAFDTLRECYQNCYLEKSLEIGGQRSMLSEKQTLTFKGNGSMLFEVSDFPSFNGLIHVSFDMRTDSSKTDIVSLISGSTDKDSSIQMYFRLNRGRFGVQMRSKYEKDELFLNAGGLQEGAWHSYRMWINPAEGEVKLKVDEEVKKLSSDVITADPRSENKLRDIKIFIGGIPIEELENEMEGALRQTPLNGCIQNLTISVENNIQRNYATFGTILVAETCSDRYSQNIVDLTNCRCKDCKADDGKIITLSGHDFLSYKMYDWSNRLYTFSDKISLHFKTKNPDTILLHAISNPKGAKDEQQFITLSLTASRGLLFEASLGGKTVTIDDLGDLTDNQWHSVDIIHERNRFVLFVDQRESSSTEILNSDVGNVFFHMDPYLYIGGVPNLNKDCSLPPDTGSFEDASCRERFYINHFYDVTEGSCKEFTFSGCGGNKNNFPDPATCLAECHRPGLRSYNNFIGCLRNVYYNDHSVFKECNFSHGKTKYFGELPAVPLQMECKMAEQSSVNFPTEDSHLKIQRSDFATNSFHLEIVYKRQSDHGVLASGYIKFLESNYQWELRVSPSDVYLIIPVDFVSLKQPVDDEIARWQKVSLVSNGQNVSIISDKGESSTALEAPIRFEREINVGVGVTEEVPGFMGCVLHNVQIDYKNINLRSFVGSSIASNDAIEDGCQMSNPCQWASTCGTETACAIVNSKPVCDCEKSSSEGANCQIAKYRKSCLDYKILGFNISGNFIIDMDGNGPIPPANVYCKFEKNGDVTTLVSHNAKQDYVFRNYGLKSFKLNITYRDFDDEMLQHLMDDSSSCSQDVKLSCTNAPLRLAKDTWFSSPWKPKIGSLGADSLGTCKCGDSGNCQDPSLKCNCNIYDNQMHEDEVTIIKKEHMPITSMYIVQRERDMVESSEAKLSLGKLACKSKEMPEQSLSFQSHLSYVTIPIWRKSDLRFSFRTTSNYGSIFYQSHSYNVPSFRITVTSEHSVTFTYKYRNEAITTVFSTDYYINEGKWNLIWIDSFRNQLRIVFNEQKKFMQLPVGQDISFFDGTAVLGFPSRSFWPNNLENQSLHGIDGCIKNLRVNDVDVDIRDLLKYSDGSAANFGCKAACDDMPCKNGGICLEKWINYRCVCQNPYAHLGDNCETNINQNAVTFLTKKSEIVHFNSSVHDSNNPLKENFTFNFRTVQSQAVLLVAKDYIQNLLHIYLHNSSRVVLMFNHGNDLVECSVTTNNIELNGGQSVQVVVTRFESSTSLTIFTKEKTFSSTVDFGVLLLSEEEYQQYPYEMFLGGVQSKGITSDLPSLVGCFRGLKIGEKIFEMSDNSNWSFDGIELGCTSSCDVETSLCKNGGQCITSFQLDSTHRCNCLGTSYSGQFCADEISYNFNERDAILLPDWVFLYKHHLKIDFAFSLNGIVNDRKEQLILAVPVEDERSNTSGVITYTWSNSAQLLIEATIGNKRYSGSSFLSNRENIRHHVYTYFKESELHVSVNKQLVKISMTVEEHDYHNETTFKMGLLIGGYMMEMEGGGDMKNFAGCISNIYIAKKDSEFWPLQQYSEGDQFLTKGLPKLGYCAAKSSKKNREPKFYDFSQLTDWKPADPQMEPLATEYDDITSDAVESLENITTIITETPPKSARTPQLWPWIMVSFLALFALIIIVVCCSRNWKCKSKADVEAPTTVRISQVDPPPYSLHPPRTEFVPLLEREPSVRSNNRVASRPSVNNGTKPPQVQDSPEESLPLNPIIAVAEPLDQTNKSQRTNKESPPLVDSVNKYKTSKISFKKQQLSPDSNSLRHIDSSLDGSSDESFHDSYDNLETPTREDHIPAINPNLEDYFSPKDHKVISIDPELLRSKLNDLSTEALIPKLETEFFEPEDLYDKQIQVTRLNTAESSAKLPYIISSKIINKEMNITVPEESSLTSTQDCKNPLPPLLPSDSSSSDSHAPNSDDEKDASPPTPECEQPDKVNDHLIDLKKYYLKRKASEPPVLPPKSK